MRTLWHVHSKCECLHMHAHLHTLRLEPKRALCCPSSALFFYRYTFCWLLCVHASTRVHAHQVCCVHTLAHAYCYIFTYTHLHTRTTALSSAPHARYFHCAVSSGCFSLPLRSRNAPLTCPRVSFLPHFFHLRDAPPSSSCNRAPSCFFWYKWKYTQIHSLEHCVHICWGFFARDLLRATVQSKDYCW